MSAIPFLLGSSYREIIRSVKQLPRPGLRLIKAWSPFCGSSHVTCLRSSLKLDFIVVNILIEDISLEISLLAINIYEGQAIPGKLEKHAPKHAFAIFLTNMETRVLKA